MKMVTRPKEKKVQKNEKVPEEQLLGHILGLFLIRKTAWLSPKN